MIVGLALKRHVATGAGSWCIIQVQFKNEMLETKNKQGGGHKITKQPILKTQNYVNANICTDKSLKLF